MSLQWRVATALAVVAAAATISVGFVSYRATSTRLTEEIDRSLDQTLGSFLANPRLAARSRDVLEVYVVQTIGPGGRLVSNVEPAVGPGRGAAEVERRPGVRSYDTIAYEDTDVRMLSYGVEGGAVQVGRVLEENARVLADLRVRTIWVVVFVTLGAAVVGWLIARTVTAPLMRLTRAATDVERSGRLDVDVPVGGHDEVGRLGTAFNAMLGALAASRADQQRLVEDAGHELRTPLTSVRTNLAVLRRHPDLDPETRGRVLRDLESETEELVVLVEEVVGLARGVTDDAPPERVALGEVADAVATRAERRHRRPVTVTADGSVVVAPIAAVERALSNLVDNAAKFDRSGGPIEIEVADGSVIVHDRGPGIAEEDRHRAFDRFYRAEGARAMPGSGLGLSIVRDVAERNGGSVRVEDRPGGGASVGFRLPVAAADAPVAPREAGVPGS